jgi:predicted DNA repair protein MutK
VTLTEPEESTDNPIAIAGILVSVMGLVLAIIVVGGFIGLVGFILSAIGYKRSKSGLRGRRLAIGGMLLGILAIAFAVLSTVILVQALSDGDSFLFGDTDSSLNEEFPPEDDVERVECRASNSGAIGQAVVTITNNSDRTAAYLVDIAWVDEAGAAITESVRSSLIDAGETAEVRVIDLTGQGVPDTCDLTNIERTVNPFTS